MNKIRTSSGLAGPIITQGFAAAVALWCAWYVTHVPWLALSEQVTMPVLVAVWLATAIWTGTTAPARPALVGLGAGFISALVGLLLIGTKLTEAPATGNGSPGFRPNAIVIAAGFLALGCAIGLIGGALGGIRRRPERSADWLARFALVAVVAVAPLVFIGGLVTSTNSGMAVPDWPNTYGSNMFLYPIGPRVRPEVYFEHAHRLFGTLVGLTMLVLTCWTLVTDRRGWVKIIVGAAFVLVCIQGVLGGVRVRLGSTNPEQDFRALAMVHGVLAQLTFGVLVAAAVFLSPLFRAGACRCGYPLLGLPAVESVVTCPECGAANPEGPATRGALPGLRRLRLFTTGLLHATILQLVLGAAYRHFRDSHSMWSHAGFSFVVLLFALMAGFAAIGLPRDGMVPVPVLRRCGVWLVGVVAVQFLLGWATFSLGGKGLQAAGPAQALLRTIHQANGALLLAVATAAFFWTRRLIRLAGLVPAPAAGRS